MSSVKLTCPQCGQHYSVEIDPSLTYEDMTCQQCGGKIPVSAAPGNSPQLKCPWCQNVFTPLFDLKEHVGGMDCPACGKGMYWPLDQYLVNRKTEPASEKKPQAGSKSSPPPAAAFFFVCSLVSFIAGDIASIFDNVALSSSLYWTGVSFILMAIYLKIQWK